MRYHTGPASGAGPVVFLGRGNRERQNGEEVNRPDEAAGRNRRGEKSGAGAGAVKDGILLEVGCGGEDSSGAGEREWGGAAGKGGSGGGGGGKEWRGGGGGGRG